jgi:hypothetical protein
MKKAKSHVNNFVNYLFAMYKVPRIPVYIHWHHNAVVNAEGRYGFGVFCWGGDERPCIHVAGKQLGKTGVLHTFAHEFVHYLQYLHGWDVDNGEESEQAAEYYGQALTNQWLINKKSKSIRIDGLLEAWNRRENDDGTGEGEA